MREARSCPSLPPGHNDKLLTTMSLAVVKAMLGKLEESQALQIEALDTARRTLGPSHPLVGRNLYLLARLARLRGDAGKAAAFAAEAGAFRPQRQGSPASSPA